MQMASSRASTFFTKRSSPIRKTSSRLFTAVSESASKTALNRIQLGKSDLKVTEVCLGIMIFGSQVSEEDSFSILDAALEKGVNFFDTAEIYATPPSPERQGRSSQIFGKWITKRNIKREDFVIATKVSGYVPKDAMGFVVANRTDPPSEWKDGRLDAKSIEAAADAELRRLNVDYIDLFQTHWPDRYVPSFGKVFYDNKRERDSIPFEEQIQAMDDLIRKGKIRHWGVSNETTYGLTTICNIADKMNLPRPITIQNSYSLVDRKFESELAEASSDRHLGIPLLPWSPLAGGVLSGKYLKGSLPEGARMSRFVQRYKRFLKDRVLQATEEYVKLAKEFGLTPTQFAYLFCKSRFFVGSTIIGVSSLEQFEEDVSCFDKDLPQEALDAIDEIHSQNPNPQDEYL